MSMECFSICLCPLLFPLAVVCSSPWRGPLNPLLVVFLSILFCVWQFWMGVCSWFSSLLVCYWCIEMLVISAHWFFILRLCWSCLSVSGDFGLRQWSLLDIQSCHLQIETIWLPPFLIGYPLCLFLAWFLWLELPILHWTGVVRGHPCLVLDFKGNASSFSPFSMILAVGLSYIAFIVLRYVP